MRALKFSTRVAALVVAALAVCLTACASKPALPSGIVNISGLIPLSGTRRPNVVAYQAPSYDRARYRGLFIEPVSLYQGPEADFGNVSQQDREHIAAMVNSEFQRVVGADFHLVDHAGPGIVRMHMSLIGIDSSHPVLSTALRLTPVGLALSGVRTVEGRGAAFVGGINIAGVAYDGESGQVLVAAQALVEPSAVNITSGLTPLRAAELSTTRAAEEFRDYLIRVKAGT